MKLLVCDYDNTILIHNKIKTSLKKIKYLNNKKGLKKYRESNNLLMIATGRYYEGIIDELKKNKIRYDYLSCNYGAELYDNSDNLLYSNPIIEEDIDLINKRKYKTIFFNKSIDDKITSINLFISEKGKYESEYNYLNKNLINCTIQKKYPKLKIIKKGVNKVDSIEYVLKSNKIDEIYTIGDSIEDREMLTKYNGYTVPWGIQDVKKISSVSKLVKQITSKSSTPSVLCIGFAKCGTTTLYDIFSQNEEIYLSGIKEPIYYGYEKTYKRGFEWYKKRYYPIKTNKVVVEINPRIAKYASAENILKDYGAGTKIIILLRNPIKRLYSNFKMNLNTGKCFDKVEKNLGNNTSNLFDKWIKENFYIDNKKIKVKDNINTNKMLNGEYYKVVKNYIDIFGRENVYICLFEDFINDKEKYSKEMFDFIGVNYQNINYDVHVNQGNRIPKNKYTIKLNSFCINYLWKDIIISKIPFISNNFSKKCNKFIWNCPIIFSKENTNIESISNYANKMITLYYYDMIEKLSDIIKIDLFKRWNISKAKEELWKD